MYLSDWLTYLEKGPKKLLEKSDRLQQFRKIAHSLKLLKWHCPIITIAGTNGKGSCVALLSTIFRAAGYRVGSYTSPHLLRYNERIQINNEFASDEKLCQVFDYIHKTRQADYLGYFDFSTLAALLLFKEANLDVIILEIGIGGRLDNVNIVDNDISVITSIDLDHTNLLGKTREAIAWQKAGIMRANTACVWGESFFLPKVVRAYAKHLRTQLYIYNQDFRALDDPSGQNNWTWQGTMQTIDQLPQPKNLLLANAAIALQVITLLQSKIPVTKQMIQRGLASVFLPGRFQVIKRKEHATIIFDVAHNPASIHLLRRNLDTIPSQRFIAVVGMLCDKDIQATLSPLTDKITYWYIGRLAYKKSAEPAKIAQCIQSQMTTHTIFTYEAIVTAYKAAKAFATTNDTLVILGSFHTVAAVLKYENISS